MPRYDVKVLVEFNYEVEADNIVQAEEEGWKWEDYTHFAEVYSIDADEQYVAEEDDDE